MSNTLSHAWHLHFLGQCMGKTQWVLSFKAYEMGHGVWDAWNCRQNAMLRALLATYM